MNPFAAFMAVQAIGNLYSGFSQAKQMEQESYDLDFNANELRYRSQLNAQNIQQESRSLYGQEVSASASGGADVSTGAPLMAYAQNFEQATKAKINLLRETDMQASSMHASANNYRKQAGRTRIAAVLGAAGKAGESLYYNHEARGAKSEPKAAGAV